MAMLTVSLVASLAATALWARHKMVETEAAERARVQASALLIGALDWARLILREDLRSGRIDHLAEPWAIGLEESRLSTFLAADKANSALLDASEDVFLSGRIQDLQARFNVTNLAESGRVNPAALVTWLRLFQQLRLDPGEAARVAERLRFASDPDRQSPAGGNAGIAPKRVEDLQRLGLSSRSWDRLEPYITLLPTPTPINVNTASSDVLQALLPKIDVAQARRVIARREREPFNTIAELAALLPESAADIVDARASVSSRYFQVRGQLRLGQRITQELAVLQRESINDIRIVWRQRSSEHQALDLGNARAGDALLQSQP